MRTLVLLAVLVCSCDMQKSTQVNVQGLAQNPNPFGLLPPGTLAVANNVVMRRKGVLSPLPASTSPIQLVTAKEPVKMFAAPSQHYYMTLLKPVGSVQADQLYLSDSSSYTSITVNSSTVSPVTLSLAFDAGASHHTFSHSRHFLTEHSAPIVVETTSETAHGAPRQAGLPPVPYVNIQPAAPGATDITVIADGKYVAYKVVLRNTTDAFVVRGAASTTFVAQNTTGGDATLGGYAYFGGTPNVYPVKTGYYVDFYRTAQADSVDELGDDFRFTASHQLTAAEITAALFGWSDNCQDADRGAPLYVNEEQETTLQTNLMPPPSVDVHTFHDTTFYAAKGAWPTATLTIPSRFGGLLTASTPERTHGIGERSLTGNTTLGGHSITNVSAADIVGIGAGQAINGSFFGAGTTVASVTGSGPYTINTSGTASATTTGSSFTIVDTITVAATKDGVTVTDTVELSDINSTIHQVSALTLVPGMQIIILADQSVNFVDGAEFTIWSPIAGKYDSFTLTVTNGGNYQPNNPLTSFRSTISSTQNNQRNRLFFSKPGEPEAVAPVNYIDVGRERILKMWNTQSALMVLCTDGLFRVTGSGLDWTVNQVDPDVSLVHPDAVCGMNNTIYGWTTDGLSVIGEDGAQSISTDAIGPTLKTYVQTFVAAGAPDTWGPSIACDNFRKEVWLNLNLPAHTPDAQQFFTSYIYNTETQAFTTQDDLSIESLVYAPYLLEIVTSIQVGGQVDWNVPSTQGFALATVVFNPLTAGDLGYLKQWTDINLFFQELVFLGESPDTGKIQALWDGETSGSFNTRVITDITGRKAHFMVPRRCALKEQLIVGFRTLETDDGATTGFNFYGFTVRYRVASETLKK